MTCRDSLSVTALFFVSSKASRLSSLAFFRSLYSCVSCFTFPACSSLSVLISSDVAHNATSAAAATPAADAKSSIGFAFITAFNAVFATVCIFVATVIPSRELIYVAAESTAERNASFCNTFQTPIAVPSPTIPLSIGTRFSETIFRPLFAYGSRFLIWSPICICIDRLSSVIWLLMSSYFTFLMLSIVPLTVSKVSPTLVKD